MHGKRVRIRSFHQMVLRSVQYVVSLKACSVTVKRTIPMLKSDFYFLSAYSSRLSSLFSSLYNISQANRYLEQELK